MRENTNDLSKRNRAFWLAAGFGGTAAAALIALCALVLQFVDVYDKDLSLSTSTKMASLESQLAGFQNSINKLQADVQAISQPGAIAVVDQPADKKEPAVSNENQTATNPK